MGVVCGLVWRGGIALFMVLVMDRARARAGLGARALLRDKNTAKNSEGDEKKRKRGRKRGGGTKIQP